MGNKIRVLSLIFASLIYFAPSAFGQMSVQDAEERLQERIAKRNAAATRPTTRPAPQPETRPYLPVILRATEQRVETIAKKYPDDPTATTVQNSESERKMKAEINAEVQKLIGVQAYAVILVDDVEEAPSSHGKPNGPFTVLCRIRSVNNPLKPQETGLIGTDREPIPPTHEEWSQEQVAAAAWARHLKTVWPETTIFVTKIPDVAKWNRGEIYVIHVKIADVEVNVGSSPVISVRLSGADQPNKPQVASTQTNLAQPTDNSSK